MLKFRRPLARRERRQISWLFAAPLLVLALIFGRQMLWEAPRFPVPPGTPILQCRRNPIFGIAGAAYVQRVESPLAPAQFWARTRPLLEAKGMKTSNFQSGCGLRAEIRDQMQRTFRPLGLSQTGRTPSMAGCAYSYGSINGNSYNVFFIPNQNGTMVEFWIR